MAGRARSIDIVDHCRRFGIDCSSLGNASDKSWLCTLVARFVNESRFITWLSVRLLQLTHCNQQIPGVVAVIAPDVALVAIASGDVPSTSRRQRSTESKVWKWWVWENKTRGLLLRREGNIHANRVTATA